MILKHEIQFSQAWKMSLKWMSIYYFFPANCDEDPLGFRPGCCPTLKIQNIGGYDLAVVKQCKNVMLRPNQSLSRPAWCQTIAVYTILNLDVHGVPNSGYIKHINFTALCYQSLIIHNTIIRLNPVYIHVTNNDHSVKSCKHYCFPQENEPVRSSY